jgi:(R)-citramalate synthase
MKEVNVEILDTTLRDGEQTSGVSFTPNEKLNVARTLLQKVGVNRVEIASARVSEGEQHAVELICRWARAAGMLDRVEVLGFVDGHASVDWIHAAGCNTVNLLTKGSLNHLNYQLRKTPEEHFAGISEVADYAHSLGMTVNAYVEDWSNGMKTSRDYVYSLIAHLSAVGVKHIMLPDTLGILNPLEVLEYIHKTVRRFPGVSFDFHAHNDYDLAISNVLAAVLAGCRNIHATVNGLGERCGNAPLASVQAILKDHFHAVTTIDESQLMPVSRLVESYSGISIPANSPIVGENVFTQVAGVHADGDNKHRLYSNALLPERFGRVREFALGKSSGKANILKNLEALGLELTPEQTRRVTQRIVELGDKKEIVTQEDLPYIVSDVLKHDTPEEKVRLVSYFTSTAYGLKPAASLRLEINGREYEAHSTGDGQYDAFASCVKQIYCQRLHRTMPELVNYSVSIPPGGRTDAFVQTVITWNVGGKEIRTRGFDADQTESAIKATIKMLNIMEHNINHKN